MLIEGHVYYVTGGASGLGLASVHSLLSKGAYVVILDMNTLKGESLSKELGLIKTLFITCDIRNEDEVINAIKLVDSKWGDKPVGGLVHCGGVGMVGKTVSPNGEPFDLSTFKETIDINLNGSFLIAARIAARIIKSTIAPPRHDNNSPTPPPRELDRGVIILTSSVSYEEGQMGQVAYGSSKAGVVGLVLPMARDLARYGIRVMAVAPSLFSTAMGANTSTKVKAGLLNCTLFPARFGEADEFGHLAIAIIENQMLNGSVIRLDGGSRMTKM